MYAYSSDMCFAGGGDSVRKDPQLSIDPLNASPPDPSRPPTPTKLKPPNPSPSEALWRRWHVSGSAVNSTARRRVFPYPWHRFSDEFPSESTRQAMGCLESIGWRPLSTLPLLLSASLWQRNPVGCSSAQELWSQDSQVNVSKYGLKKDRHVWGLANSERPFLEAVSVCCALFSKGPGFRRSFFQSVLCRTPGPFFEQRDGLRPSRTLWGTCFVDAKVPMRRSPARSPRRASDSHTLSDFPRVSPRVLTCWV